MPASRYVRSLSDAGLTCPYRKFITALCCSEQLSEKVDQFMSTNRDFNGNSAGLNLRSEPRVKATNLIAALSMGDTVTKIAEAPDPKWWQV